MQSNHKRRVKTMSHYETEAWNLIHRAEAMEKARMENQKPGGLGSRHLFEIDLVHVISNELRKRDDQVEADRNG
jgi:hypothetical protein